MSYIKKLYIRRPGGSLPDDWSGEVEDQPGFKTFDAFKKKLISEGKIISWERSGFVNDEAVLDIELDSAGTWKTITDFSQSLGDWKGDFQVFDSSKNRLP